MPLGQTFEIRFHVKPQRSWRVNGGCFVSFFISLKLIQVSWTKFAPWLEQVHGFKTQVVPKSTKILLGRMIQIATGLHLGSRSGVSKTKTKTKETLWNTSQSKLQCFTIFVSVPLSWLSSIHEWHTRDFSSGHTHLHSALFCHTRTSICSSISSKRMLLAQGNVSYPIWQRSKMCEAG